MIPATAAKLPRSFLFGFFVPSIACALALWCWRATTLIPPESERTSTAAMLFLAALGLAALLQVLNPFFIRIFEGAPVPLRKALPWLRNRQIARLRKLKAEIQKAKDNRLCQDEAYAMEYRRYLVFPSEEGDVLPTTLGNTIAAWEHYPYRRYGIDAITMWPRLAPLLSKAVAEAIADSKARFDLFLNFFLLSLAGAGVGLYRLGLAPHDVWRWAAAAAVLLAVGALWSMSIVAAVGWGETVKAAFDLHRLDILKQLGVRGPERSWTAKEEKRVWEELQWSMKFDHTPELLFAPRGATTPEAAGRDGEGDDEEEDDD